MLLPSTWYVALFLVYCLNLCASCIACLTITRMPQEHKLDEHYDESGNLKFRLFDFGSWTRHKLQQVICAQHACARGRTSACTLV